MAACSALLFTHAFAATPEELIAGADARIDQFIQADSGKAFVPDKVRASLKSGRPYFSRHYSWSVVGFAGRCFYLNEMLAEANAALIQNGKYYLRELTAQEEASILETNAGTELNTNQYSRITNRDTTHWHADVILRLIDMYGTNGSVAAGRMSPEAEAKSLEYISQYVRLIAKLSKAEYLQSKTWDSYESENHHAMDFRTHWHFSKIVKDRSDYQSFVTDSGATPTQLYEAYNAYFVEYAREKFRKGLFAEMMQKGYNSATYSGFYNFHDFGNPEVKEHARMLLDLFWAYYAQEQFNDVLGGGKSRVTFSSGFTAGHAGTTGEFAWFYFLLGEQPSGVDGRSINAYFSDYRPPAVVADIATDIAGRGIYEVRQTAQGLGTTGSTNADVSLATTPHQFRTDGGGIVRYSYCTPAFIMGTPMVEARPKNDWVGYACQNRWQGVIFSADVDHEMARIVPCVLPNDGKTAFNAHWAVQSKGSMISQMLNTHQGGKEKWVWISKDGLNSDPVIEDNIVFVDIADAYAAIRVVGTTYSLDEDFDAGLRPHFVVRPTDKFKPVILEVMAKTEVADFAAFKTLVKANAPTLTNGVVSYTTIYGDALTLDTGYIAKPTINGVNVDYSPAKSFDSPFLHGDYNGEVFTIEKGTRRKVYHIAASPTIDGLVEDLYLEPGTTDTHTISGVNVPEGTDKLVLVASWEQASEVISATWNGVESFIEAVDENDGRNSAILYLDHPTAGIANVVLTFGANTNARVGVLSLTGVADGVAFTSEGSGFSGSLTTTMDNVIVVGVCTNNTNGGALTGGPFVSSLYNGGSGSSQGNAGFQFEPNAGAKSYTWTGTEDGATHALAGFAPKVSYLGWVSDYAVGAQSGFGDDPDGDGKSNGLENYLGTDPDVRSRGMVMGSFTEGANPSFTFNHPLNVNPASDVNAVYRWSKDLVNFHDDGDADGEGTTVTFSQGIPSDGEVTVTATCAGSAASRVFVVIQVTQD